MQINQHNKPTLLIVDDESNNIKFLINALGNQNYHIRVATDGVKALDIVFGSQPPDVILLDINMPDADGYHVCQEIRQHNKFQNIPILFTSDNEAATEVEKGLSMGAADYIFKPFHIPTLKARVKTHSECKIKADLLEKFAAIDGLTNIPNKQQFDEKLTQEWQRCQRSEFPVSLTMIDIDQFRQFNDDYGHPAGDECLKQIAKILTDCLRRSGDFIARYGGDKFVAILPNTDKAGAVKIASDFQSTIESLNIANENSSGNKIVTLSIGVGTLTPSADLKPEQLLEHASRMLQHAKDEGKNQIKSSELPS